MLYQLSYSRKAQHRRCHVERLTLDMATAKWWTGEDSNLRSRKTLDLQSSPVDRFGTRPGYVPACHSW